MNNCFDSRAAIQAAMLSNSNLGRPANIAQSRPVEKTKTFTCEVEDAQQEFNQNKEMPFSSKSGMPYLGKDAMLNIR